MIELFFVYFRVQTSSTISMCEIFLGWNVFVRLCAFRSKDQISIGNCKCKVWKLSETKSSCRARVFLFCLFESLGSLVKRHGTSMRKVFQIDFKMFQHRVHFPLIG